MQRLPDSGRSGTEPYDAGARRPHPQQPGEHCHDRATACGVWSLAVSVIGVPTAPRYAAIAYLDADAPDLLPLGAGDVPAVNAVRAVLRAHATSPPPSPTAFRSGCGGLPPANLHADVLVTSRRAVVGSAALPAARPSPMRPS